MVPDPSILAVTEGVLQCVQTVGLELDAEDSEICGGGVRQG